MTMSNAQTIIETESARCIAEAIRQGATDDYELTAPDCEWIDDKVKALTGRRPTKQDWTDAGYPHIGGAHYERDIDG